MDDTVAGQVQTLHGALSRVAGHKYGGEVLPEGRGHEPRFVVRGRQRWELRQFEIVHAARNGSHRCCQLQPRNCRRVVSRADGQCGLRWSRRRSSAAQDLQDTPRREVRHDMDSSRLRPFGPISASRLSMWRLPSGTTIRRFFDPISILGEQQLVELGSFIERLRVSLDRTI